MYVLPYGQMSLWGATVITNLMSAIPWVGQDIVESKALAEILTQAGIGLPIIGLISSKVHINRKNRLSSNEYISIPSSFIGFLVGFIDGDGYIQIVKTEKGYISLKLVISIHLEDISTYR